MIKKKHLKGKILLTGGAGFIGSHVAERLLADGERIVLLDNFNDYYNPKIKEDNIKGIRKNSNLSLIKGDILDKSLLKKVFSENQISKIIHLAAIAGVRPSLLTPGHYVDIDIKGTINLLEMAKEYKVNQFIFASSSSVYGENSKVPFEEKEKELIPLSPYSTSKLSGETFCQTYSKLYKLPVTVLRYFTVFGPRQRPEMALHKFTRLMKQKKSIPMYGSGTSIRDYTFIDDVVEGTVLALKNKFDFEIFNLGNSRTVKLKEMIKTLSKELSINPKIKKMPVQLGDVPVTFAGTQKAKRLLDWSPKVSFEDGVKKFVVWHNEKENLLNKLI